LSNAWRTSLTEDINTKAANGRLIFHIFAVLAEFERNLIRERTMAGLATARARGRLGGARRKTTKNTMMGCVLCGISGKFTGAEVAKQFSISVPTFSAECAQRVSRRRIELPGGWAVASILMYDLFAAN
jgi:DNA invertase Pin-like site-specific DNA recombinase